MHKTWLSSMLNAAILKISMGQTNTHTQNDYRNPRCACAPRVNYYFCCNAFSRASHCIGYMCIYCISFPPAKSGSVDATITNLLEGLVPYDSLPPPPPPQPTSTCPPAPAPPASSVKLKSRLYTSPAMDAMRRQLSFDERKRAMLENARRFVNAIIVCVCACSCVCVLMCCF